ncbi:glycoprotein precursor [Big brushy tank virus]|uniref:Pre-glycoprotein polyprotein GP complex n=1 Tax=Big brushy tank virus TaxID=466144 RepID=C0SKW7_WWAVU|nr:glycoprotein precursor [Big brushy tank virus]
MGQLVSFFGEIPSIINEALNVALIAVSIIAAIKGVINIWKSGILQLIFFLLLAGRSCSITIGHHVELQHVVLNMSTVIPFVPSPCRLNNTHFLLRGPFEAPWGLQLTITDIAVLVNSTGGSSKELKPNNISVCFEDNNDLDHVSFTLGWLFKNLGHNFEHDPIILCDSVRQDKVFRIQLNITRTDYSDKLLLKMKKIFGTFNDPCVKGEVKNYIQINNVSWTNQCQVNHLNSMHFILQSAYEQVIRSRKPKNFFSWSLTDSTGSDMPGGYCLEKWMLVSSELKCFGNTAVAKCNLNHDSEFCDMLRLFDFNKKAISTLQNKTKHQIDIVITAVNSLISDNILMKNKVKELVDIPYCNYTKFWYVNHTGFNVHSLPKCWLTKNGSYLNISDFRNEWLLESDHLISEILSREYEERQSRTPLSLVDICFWSTLFYTASIFLHLLRIPTHRHIVGEGCPRPHRLNRASLCSCGYFKQRGRPLKWVRKV